MKQWKAGLELKLHGARRLTIRAWGALKQAKGSVVFMSGSAALDPKPGLRGCCRNECCDYSPCESFRRAGH